MFATIEDLRGALGAKDGQASVAYAEKMLHKVPEAPVVDRAGFLVDLCRGKKVVEFGASGPMHAKIAAVASDVLGVDREPSDGIVGYDLDDVTRGALPMLTDAEVVVCGEVLEHLSNPGYFLSRLRQQYAGVTTVVTVPNAFSEPGRQHILRGTENVNVDHVAWYSFRTLKTLLTRAGYESLTFAWYGGKPLTAEGLIVVLE